MPQLYGPFPVQTHNPDGSLTGNLAPGVHYTADGPVWTANQALLQPYLAAHAWPLQFAMAGDDPASPTNSYPISFPDQATADSVMAQLV